MKYFLLIIPLGRMCFILSNWLTLRIYICEWIGTNSDDIESSEKLSLQGGLGASN